MSAAANFSPGVGVAWVSHQAEAPNQGRWYLVVKSR
jgi:hypothetical protein